MDYVSERALAKARRHIIPLLFLGYMFAILDRGNISIAALRINADLGISATVFGWATAAFYVGYLACEVPSNLALQRFGSRVWIARIMLTWGLVTALTAFVTTPGQFLILRFLLGASEAGFLPGVIFYLTFWFPASQRAKVTADFTMSIPLMSAIGAIVSSSLLTLEGHGLKGWQWMFLIEAVPPLILGLLILRYLPSNPDDAGFLDASEKAAISRLIDEGVTATGHTAPRLAVLFTNKMVWLLGLTNLGFILTLYTVSTWMPQLVKGFGFTEIQTGWLVALPQLAGVVGMAIWGRMGPRFINGPFALTLPLAIGLIFLLIAVFGLSSAVVAIAALTVATGAVYAAIPAFWNATTHSVGWGASAGAIALINTIGSFSGVLGPPVVGVLKDRTHSFAAGFGFAAAILLLSLVLAVVMRRAGQSTAVNGRAQ